MSYKRERKLSRKKRDELLEEARDNIERFNAYFIHNIRDFETDKRFFQGEQWDRREWGRYVGKGKIPYTFDLLTPLIRQIVGEQKNMQPSISLVPQSQAMVSAEQLKLMSGLIRHQAYSSNAAMAYAQAFENAVVAGYGVIEVATDYVNPYTFDQDFIIRPVIDPRYCIFDPNAKDKSKVDGDFCARAHILSEDDFKATYPDAEVPTEGGNFFGIDLHLLAGFKGKVVVVVDYYKKYYKNKTLIRITNGYNFVKDVLQEDIDAVKAGYLEQMQMAGVPLFEIPPLFEAAKRDTKIAEIKCHKMTSQEVIKSYRWQSKYLPLVFVDGFSTEYDGKQYTKSFIRPAIPAQKAYNYARSEILNNVPRLNKAQVWLTKQQAAGNEKQIRNPDNNDGVNFFNPSMPGDKPTFGPKNEIPQTLLMEAEQCREDVYRSLGVYPANRGQIETDASAKAIGRTIMQGNLVLTQMLNNLYDGMETVGRICLDLIPRIYDTQRIVTLLTDTNETTTATINQMTRGGVVNDVTSVVYRLQVRPVANFMIQRERIQEMLGMFAAQMGPEYQAAIAPLWASLLESPISPELQEIFRAMMPAPVKAALSGKPLPPNPQAQLAMQAERAKIKETQSKTQKNVVDMQARLKELQLQEQKQMQDVVMEARDQELRGAETLAKINETNTRAAAELAKAEMETGRTRPKNALEIIRHVAQLDMRDDLQAR